jgi:hypothetical protein
LPAVARGKQPAFAKRLRRAAFSRFASEGWWARQASNLQPDCYEREGIASLILPRFRLILIAFIAVDQIVSGAKLVRSVTILRPKP